MINLIFVRHGECEHIGKFIAGRKIGIHLNSTGIKEIEKTADILEKINITKMFSSPIERACETAGIVSKRKQIDYEIIPELTEVDYGDWTGLSFSELSKNEMWAKFNRDKKKYRIPNGEMLIEIECRMSFFVEKIRKGIEGNIVVVSHGDPIKCCIAHYAGIPLDLIGSFEIHTGSISLISVDDYGSKIQCINYMGNRIDDCI